MCVCVQVLDVTQQESPKLSFPFGNRRWIFSFLLFFFFYFEPKPVSFAFGLLQIGQDARARAKLLIRARAFFVACMAVLPCFTTCEFLLCNT